MTKFSAILIGLLLCAMIILLVQNHKLSNIIEKQKENYELAAEYLEYFSDFASEKMGKNKQNYYDSEHFHNLLDNYNQHDPARKDTISIKLSDIKQRNYQEFETKDFLPEQNPIKSKFALSQKFSNTHPALDFATQEGTKVFSVAAGKILSIYDDEYFGKALIIDHLNGYFSFYAHLKNTLVKENIIVEKGELIATVGNTGNSSAPHLHLEIIKNGANLDPIKFLKNLNRSDYGKK